VNNQSPFGQSGMGQNNRGPDSKNFILAMVLSMAIIFGWQFFFVPPAPPPGQPAQTAQQQNGAAPGAAATGTIIDRSAALTATSRVPIETPELSGSINLAGAQFDDLHLNNYRETVNPASPVITLLSPSNTDKGYFIEQGLVPAAGQTVKVPDSKTVWTAPQGAKLTASTPLVLSWDNGAGVVFRREISITDQYVFTVRQIVENKSPNPIALLPYARVQRQGTPKVEGYFSFFEGMLGALNEKLVEIKYSDLGPGIPATETATRGGWLGFTDKYWATSLIPEQARNINTRYQYVGDATRAAYQADYTASEPLVIAGGSTGLYEDHVFAGAKIVQTISTVGEKHKISRFDLMIDWGWYPYLTKPMFWLMEWAKGLLGNFGLAILLVTVLVKLALFPLANKSYASMSKMKKLQPEMERIKAEFPDDRMKQQQAIMEMYKKEKVSPLSGCLPVLIQIPIFFAVYKVILTTIELRHAPFFGWIHDLAAPDPTSIFNLFGLLPFTPPHILMLGIWPILMGITMWVQMRLNPTPPDPVQAAMFNWMPLLFTFMLASMPAGLVIYWTWSNLLSILQQSYIMKKHGTEINLLGNIRDAIPFLKKKPAT
jgi:YidC/Oxa1 family membrane protein insertase